MRLLYFGTPQFAVPALEALFDSPHEVVAVVSQPDRPRGRGHRLHATPTKAAAHARGVRVLQPLRLRAPEFLDELSNLRADLGVVAAYGRILPDQLLELPRLGLVNVHASLLPKYRGAAPVHRAVIAGDTVTGVSIMHVVKALDAGPVYLTGSRPIGPDETTPDVERGLAALGAQLLVEVLDALGGDGLRPVPQDDSRATHAPKIERHEGAIDWQQPAAQIHNLVRGLQPWPMVSAMVGDTRCLIHRTALVERMADVAGGSVVSAENGDLIVAAGDGRLLRILEIQPEGKRPMSAREFLAGRRLETGAVIRRP